MTVKSPITMTSDTQQMQFAEVGALKGNRKNLLYLLLSLINGDVFPSGQFGAAGTATALRALVLDANKKIDTLSLTGLFFESAADALTAHAGGGQASALALTAEVNRFTTVATAGDSAKLPASSPGLSILIINSGANPMQVFGAGTDTINDVATATGVSQMPNSAVLYACTVAGKWYANGTGEGFAGSLLTQSYADGLTAHAGGGQGSATAITTSIARFTTVATLGDSAQLPAAAAGLGVTVINAGVAAMNVYPVNGGSDQINALSANTPFSIPAGAVCEFYTTVTGHWHTILASNVPQPAAYNTASSAVSFTATNANVTGGGGYSNFVELDLTGNPAGAANVTLPTVANLLALMPNAAANQTYVLRIKNSANSNTWTVVTNTGWTLNGTMTIATGTWREFLVTLTSIGSATATLQNLGGGTI